MTSMRSFVVPMVVVSSLFLVVADLAAQVPLDELIAVSECTAEETPEGLVLKGFGYVRTPEIYSVPLKIQAVAKTDSTNLRLHFAKGHVILNWEVNLDDLAMHEPVYGHARSVKAAGRIPCGEWVTVVWIIERDRLQVLVDDKVRFDSLDAEITDSDSQNYGGLSGPVCIGPAWGSTVTVRSLTVTKP
jgi:hypothetical protein